MCNCALTCILKCVMSIVNSLLLVMGIVLAVLGAILLWGFGYFLKGVYPIETFITKMLAKFGVTGNGQQVINLMSANAYSIGAISFIVGIVLLAFAIFGIICVVCCDFKSCLKIIIIVVMVMSLGLIILIGIFGANKSSMIFDPLMKYIQIDILNKYKGINATNPESLVVNVLQITASCCGLHNFQDFDNATNFNRSMINADKNNIFLLFPISCCDYKSDFTIGKTTLEDCITNGNSTLKNIGCWSKVQPYLDKYLNYGFLTMGIAIVVLIAIMITGIVAIWCINKIP